MARVASTSLFKRIRVFSNFCVYYNFIYLILCIFFFSLFTFVSHYFILFFYPRLLNVCTCAPCVQVATPLLPIRLKRTKNLFVDPANLDIQTSKTETDTKLIMN